MKLEVRMIKVGQGRRLPALFYNGEALPGQESSTMSGAADEIPRLTITFCVDGRSISVAPSKGDRE